MSIERSIYKTPFRKAKQPQWLCPTCRRGILSGIKGTFFYEESKKSEDARKDDSADWDPEWMEYIYSCSFKCTNPQCGDIVASVGSGSIDYEPEFDELTGEPVGMSHYDYFQPKFFYPHLKIFEISKNTPEPIRVEIEKSFELFFSSPSSSSNHIRIALEKILDYLKVKKYNIKNKKRILISLHKRILFLTPNYSNLIDALLAIKWLGNTGSHGAKITINDVMDAYEILEIVLHEIFDKKTKTINKLVRQINKKKGPQRRIK